MNGHTSILYISHGGGPLPLLGDAGHQEMVAALKSLGRELPRPAAILVVSAHWEEARPSLTSSAQPSLLYDYYGFPEESYRIGYPCPGAPELAAHVQSLAGEMGMEMRLDGDRGLDHGVFVPLTIMFPEADIPCIQLSLMQHLDPQAHIHLGEVLAKIHHEKLLIIEPFAK